MLFLKLLLLILNYFFQAAGTRVGTVISAVVTLGASIIIAFIFGWKLALALLAVVPILLIAGALQMKVLKGHQRRDAELMSNAGSVSFCF